MLVIGSVVKFTEVNVGILVSPFVDEINPIAVFELVQLKVSPVEVVGVAGVPARLIWGTVNPAQ